MYERRKEKYGVLYLYAVRLVLLTVLMYLLMHDCKCGNSSVIITILIICRSVSIHVLMPDSMTRFYKEAYPFCSRC